MAGFCPITLQIVKGIPTPPGLSTMVESPLEVLDLLDGTHTIGLATDGWSPNFPTLKGGGLWANSAVSDGQTLLSNAVDKVTETLTLVMGNTDLNQRQIVFSKLVYLSRMARDFWTRRSQIEPVYLKMQAAQGRHIQYALISNIEIAERGDMFSTNIWEFTLTVDREPMWNIHVPPGANPKLWTKEINGFQPGTGFTFRDLSLVSGTDHLITGTIYNRNEWSASGVDAAPLTANYIDIPAASIPGDAPAKVCMYVEGGTAELYVGRSTKRLTMSQVATTTPTLTFETWKEYLILNAGEPGGTSLTTVATDASCGVLLAASAGVKKIAQYTIAISATVPDVLVFVPGISVLRRNVYGSYIAFLRVEATTGVDSDVQARLRIRAASGNPGLYVEQTLEYQNIPVVAGTGVNCDNRFDLIYMGSFSIPLSPSGVTVLDVGYGLDHEDTNFIIDLKNTAAATRAIDFLDLILIPIDEGVINFKILESAVAVAGHIYDNTGYFTHGYPGEIGLTDSGGNIAITELQGSGIYLQPKVDNRLYFIGRENDNPGVGDKYSTPTNSGPIRLNIVPRCYGISDV